MLGLLGLAAYLRRHSQRSLGTLTELLALGAGLIFALLSAGHPLTATINLSLATLTLVIVLWRRQLRIPELISLTHGAGLLALVNGIYFVWPGLSLSTWSKLALGGAIAEWVIHVVLRSRPFAQNAWWAGLGLAGVSYWLMIGASADRAHPLWLWLCVPVVLTGVAHHRRALYPRAAAIATLVDQLWRGDGVYGAQ